MWRQRVAVVAALVTCLVDGIIIKVPGFVERVREFVTITWDTQLETAESLIARFKALLGGDGMWLYVQERLDTVFDASAGDDGVGPNAVQAIPSMDREPEWRVWHQVAGLLHSICAQLQPVSKTMRLELEGRRNASASVGVFLLKSPGRNIWHALTSSFRAGWLMGALRGAALHVLVHNVDDWRPQEWRELLAEAATLFAGVHWCYGEHARFKDTPGAADRLWENYFNKVFTMAHLAKLLRYEHIACLDDDVFLPASALAFLVESGPRADAAGCGVVAPLLQNGVPSVELWAKSFLDAEDRKVLERCFEGSSSRWFHEPWHSPGVEPFPKPWDGPSWYRKVAEGEETDFKGIHPVRGNRTCMEHAVALAVALVPREWDRWRTDHDLIVDRERVFPYLCNNAFLMRTDLYREAIERPELQRTNGADEVPMNLLMAERRLPFCFVRNSFGIHPVYNHHPERDKIEFFVLHAVMNSNETGWSKV